MSVGAVPSSASASDESTALAARLLADKTATLARLAAGIAHELRNPLAVILARVQLLELAMKGGKPLPPGKLETTLRTVGEQAVRASKIIESLSIFARPRVPVLESVDLGQIIGHVLSDLRAESSEHRIVTTEADVAPEAMPAVADSAQLTTALRQLTLDALQATLTERLGRVLLVADGAAVLEVLNEYFSSQGYAVETAHTGADALTVAQHSRPDLVLRDIRMPGMDGVEVLKKLRELDPGLAVIMVTANEDSALARETLKIGAFDYVSKPFDFGHLDRAVSAAIVHSGGLAPVGTSEATPDWFQGLALQVFRATRGMAPVARESVGTRLESAALELTREASAGRPMTAVAALAEIEMLTAIAADLGDLTSAVQSTLESALASVRKALSHV